MKPTPGGRIAALATLAIAVAAGSFLLLGRGARTSPLSPGPKPPRTRVLVVGIDGATWRLIRPWLGEGRMPNLKRLMDDGVSATLETVLPADSPPGWTSAVTGVNPGKHGLFGFLRPLGRDLKPDFVSSADRGYLALWEILSRQGRKVGVVNVPCTSPPDAVVGFMVGGFPHRNDDPVSYPRDLIARHPEYRLEVFGSTPKGGDEDVWLENLYQIEGARAKLTHDQLALGGYDLFWVVFTGTDRVMHHFWKFMDPHHPGYDPGQAERFGSAIRDIHVEVDRRLGELVAAAGPGAITMVVSDHGFGPTYQGIALEPLMKRLNPDPQAPDYPSAYLYNYYGGVFINLKGRDPLGTVAPGAEYDAERGRVTAVLRSLADPTTARPLIHDVRRREEVYSGEAIARAPDLLFTETDGYLTARFPSAELVGTLPPGHFSGSHRQEGIFVLHGPGVRRGARLGPASILSVTPTLLYLLGEPVPTYMDGVPLADAIDPPWLERHPPRSIARDGHRAPHPAEASPAAPEVEEQLRSIGYLQ